jgi:hypothetical protein
VDQLIDTTAAVDSADGNALERRQPFGVAARGRKLARLGPFAGDDDVAGILRGDGTDDQRVKTCGPGAKARDGRGNQEVDVAARKCCVGFRRRPGVDDFDVKTFRSRSW